MNAGRIDSVLYGPSIEFRSDEWLKCSLLLWDKVYRMVPRAYLPVDPPFVRCAEDAGLVRAVHLEREDLASVSSEFLSFLQSVPFTPAGLERGGTERLHPEKVDGRLYPLLEKLAIRVDPDGWLQVPREIAHGYMVYLAKAVSGRRNLATVTDSVDEWAILPYFKEHGNFSESVYDPTASAFYSFMLFTDILPKSVEAVPPEKIIEFAAKRRDEKQRLREVLNEFAAKLSLCSSASHIRELIHDFERDILKAKADYRKSMEFYTEDQGHSLLTVGLPIALGALSLLGPDPYTVLKISGTVLVGAMAAYANVKKVKFQNRKDSYVSYLVEVDSELGGRVGRVPLSHRIFEEFMND